MTQQLTRIYASGKGSTADVVWDDVTMLASGVQVHIDPSEPSPITFYGDVTFPGQPGPTHIIQSYPPGAATIWTLPLPIGVTRVTGAHGAAGLAFAGFTNFGVS